MRRPAPAGPKHGRAQAGAALGVALACALWAASCQPTPPPPVAVLVAKADLEGFLGYRAPEAPIERVRLEASEETLTVISAADPARVRARLGIWAHVDLARYYDPESGDCERLNWLDRPWPERSFILLAGTAEQVEALWARFTDATGVALPARRLAACAWPPQAGRPPSPPAGD